MRKSLGRKIKFLRGFLHREEITHSKMILAVIFLFTAAGTTIFFNSVFAVEPITYNFACGNINANNICASTYRNNTATCQDGTTVRSNPRNCFTASGWKETANWLCRNAINQTNGKRGVNSFRTGVACDTTARDFTYTCNDGTVANLETSACSTISEVLPRIQSICGGTADTCRVATSTTPTPSVTCTDSDGGNNIFARGTTVGYNDSLITPITSTDFCFADGGFDGRGLPIPLPNGRLLREFNCLADGQVTSSTVLCPADGGFQCQSGACISSSTPPATTSTPPTNSSACVRYENPALSSSSLGCTTTSSPIVYLAPNYTFASSTIQSWDTTTTIASFTVSASGRGTAILESIWLHPYFSGIVSLYNMSTIEVEVINQNNPTNNLLSGPNGRPYFRINNRVVETGSNFNFVLGSGGWGIPITENDRFVINLKGHFASAPSALAGLTGLGIFRINNAFIGYDTDGHSGGLYSNLVSGFINLFER